jgi:hypothetical protein
VLPEEGLPDDAWSWREGFERALAVYQLAFPHAQLKWPAEVLGPLSGVRYFATPRELLEFLPKRIHKSVRGPLTTEHDRMATRKSPGPIIGSRQSAKMRKDSAVGHRILEVDSSDSD